MDSSTNRHVFQFPRVSAYERVDCITNVVLSEFQLMIRMDGTGEGEGKDELHLCVPSSENSDLC